MEKKTNKYIAVAYKLYATKDGKKELIEEAPASKPFQFISGFGVTIDAFEKNIENLSTGDTFDFTLSKDEAYGDYVAERVIELEKSIFCINNHFDHEHIFKGAIVPLQNEDGNRFNGLVLDITDDKVKMDLNHPLAGRELNFKGSVVTSREASNEEIQGMLNRLSGEGCCCGDGCGDCGDGCGHHDDEGHRHHGHNHHGCGCGHCH